MRHSLLLATLVAAAAWSLPQAAAAEAAAPADIRQSMSAYLAKGHVTTVSATAASGTAAAALRAAISAGNYTSQIPSVVRQRCPQSCSSAGLSTRDWYTYHSLNRLSQCNATMLLDFALFNDVNVARPVSISACTADLESAIDTDYSKNSTLCSTGDVLRTQVTSSLQLATSGSSSSTPIANLLDALSQLQVYMSLSEPQCEENIKFASAGDVIVGVYVGSALVDQGVSASVLKQLNTQIQSGEIGIAETTMVELCNNYSARYSLGVYISSVGDFSAAQQGVQAWKNGSCIAGIQDTASSWQEVTFLKSSASGSTSAGNSTVVAGGNSTVVTKRSTRSHHSLKWRDDTCSTVQIVYGDTCTTLADECGITETEFADYNSETALCDPDTTLVVGQYACCSAGDLPDLTPQQDEDGYCYSYLVQTGDSCSSLSAAYGITNEDIEDYNTDTWGWNGCDKLFADYYICLSSGYPPMPATVANAVCGPQVNDTATAPPGTDLTQLNQCPLNACCDVWGQCGTTAEFCTISNSTTGAPGTAAENENGCISNCGTDIISSDPPSETYAIAYFEAFDWQRSCLHMSVTDVDTSAYTHIHYSFVTINEDFTINTDDVADQLPFLVALTDIKRIITIGGWSFSTDASTYAIFRDAVSSETNRQTLISNLVDFLDQYSLDGVDWDWEYPGEPDIPGIPAGTEDDGTGYFLLLDELKEAMPSGKTISLTAPSSYWYLQNFPIEALAEVCDYIVFMTYDLHGQWDYDNENSDSGCPGGNCLRSHVNMTETVNALSMITKAGVPSNMIAIGVSSYGRSFEMTAAGCWSEECTYTGPESGAVAGPCTNTSGYIADYEIKTIIDEDSSAQELWDEDSYSNIVVWDNTQWVAYMNETNKAVRVELYESLGFLGFADWAVDLQSEDGTSSDNDTDSSGDDFVYIDPEIWGVDSPHITALPGQTLVWPPMPLSSTTTISFPVWTTTVTYKSATVSTTTATDGSTSTYPALVYVSWLTELTIPPVTTTAIAVWGVTLDTSSTDGPIVLTSSVQPVPFTVTVTPIISGTTSIIGATTTSTTTGVAVVWGDYTYNEPTQTETLGGTTTIIGGLTLGPTVITVTPNPYPTTVPSTTDPVLNSKTVSWTSGDPPTYTTEPGCDGCGTSCTLFCDSDCPSCPAGVFGSDGSSEDGDDDDDDDEDDGAQNTVLAETLIDDVFPTTFAPWDVLSSLAAADTALWNLVSHAATTTTSTTDQATPTTTAESTPTAIYADCAFWDAGYGWYFEILNIINWATDGGKGLHDNENGCGGVTGWDWHDATDETYAKVWFSTSFFISDGCIERAIASAGGPDISCDYQGFNAKRAAEVRAIEARRVLEGPQPPSYTDEQVADFKEFFSNETEYRQYTPMDWSAATTSSSLASTITAA